MAKHNQANEAGCGPGIMRLCGFVCVISAVVMYNVDCTIGIIGFAVLTLICFVAAETPQNREDSVDESDEDDKYVITVSTEEARPKALASYSHKEIYQAADKLRRTLIEMSKDPQVDEVLDDHPTLEQAMVLDIGGGMIDKRLVVVATTDLIRCFEGLEHEPDMMSVEGRAIATAIHMLLMPHNRDILKNEEVMMTSKGTKVLEDCYNLVKSNFTLNYDPDRFLLIDMLREGNVDEETIRKWAVVLYRYVLLIAKADGHLSDAEQKWLTSLLSITGTESDSPALPKDIDPLFKEAARYVVKSGCASISSIQREFSIGYSRAGKIMDQLEAAGIVGPANVGKPRTVLLDSVGLKAVLSNYGSPEPKKAQAKPVADPMKELEALIGLERVKTEIANIYNLVKVQKVRQEKGLNVPAISYHCLFTGNPGTGKTTVARLVGQIYKQLGIIKKGHLVETDRSGLVAEYVGQTAVKTNKIIDSALDGVLFIDEAYSLVQGGDSDYGLEAIATLLKRMEDNRDRLVVILAGYSKEMEDFINANPGLQSRFNRYIHFDDYSADELSAIFTANLAKYDYKLTPEAEEALNRTMTEAVANKDKNFGNARFVRNLFEKTLERQAKRLAANPLATLTETALTEITAPDLP